MIKIGITGGIGCGKTTIVKKFIDLGIKAYMLDDRSKHLVNTNQNLRNDLIDMFGREVFNTDGSYNTKLVSDIVFKLDDKTDLIELTNLFGKYINDDYKLFLTENKDEDYVVVESAYFFEYDMLDMLHWVDFILGIETSLSNRIERVKLRNPNLSEDEIIKRINAQMDQEEKMNYCDFVLNNDNKVEDNEIMKMDTLFRKLNGASVQ